jgi:hypothetical protein
MAEAGDTTSSQEAAGTGEIHRAGSGAYERTWELELLISGAVTFALLQLPATVDRWYFSTEPMVTGNTRYLLLGLYEYAKFILYALIPSFIVHLAARAYWVGLIGLDSVFPHGVVWEKHGRLPIARVVYRERQPSLEALIRATDRFCSIIFSFAFSIAFIFLFSIAGMLVLWLIAFGASTLLFGGERFGQVFFAIFALLLGPLMIASLLDSAFGGKLDAGRGLGRAIDHVQRARYTFFLAIAYLPTLNVLASNIRKVTFYPMFYGALLVLIGMFTVKDVLVPSGTLTATAYEYLPDRAGRYTLEEGHYADQRRLGPGFRRPVPYIQSETVRGPYLRLFLPYTRQHGAAIERSCPGVAALGGSGPRFVAPSGREPTAEQMGALFACLQRIQPVFLGGTPLAPRLRLARDPLTGLRGTVAFIPTAGMPEGESELVIPAIPRENEAAPGDTFHIPFWIAR